ncbi:MotA/TolQ/ExbB proton channel family protein [Ectothiorhodospiraceae bacterium 2226]|nr:MotA/TolQ/ExbB proton channel family protein [Ectothiorhodospiraceae bacterium 2226]
MRLYELLQLGGPVMLVLLALSVLATAIVLYKLAQYAARGVWHGGSTRAALDQLAHGEAEAAHARLAAGRGPLAVTTAAALRCAADRRLSNAQVEAEIARVGTAQVRELEGGLRALSAIAHLSPLLGLLGTVFGMIRAFMQVEGAGPRVDPSLLAGGIWEALLTTAFGLTIAIPAMAAFYFLEGAVDRVRAAMKDNVVRVLIYHGRQPAAQEVEPQAQEDYAV